MNSVSLKDKYRFVRCWGVIARKRINYTFTGFPNKDSPVLHAENKSRWKLIDEVYQIINEYK